MAEFNAYQRAIANTYGGGDYAHVETLDECRNVGDTLFTFLMIECATSEGCDSAEEANRRLHMAMDNIQEVIGSLGA